MKIMIINSVSSSIKYQLMEMPENKVLSKGLIERIGIEGGHLHQKYFKNGSWLELKTNFKISDHISGFEQINILLSDSQIGVIKIPDEIFAIGHRVGHGGHPMTKTIEISKKVKKVIRSVFPLAPLHNPANLLGIAEKVFPKAKEFAVFYTAFHKKIHEKVHRYAFPEIFYKKYHIRSNVFHGISHQYVSRTAIDYLKNPRAKIITLHLGNGASLAVIKEGISTDPSMGFGTNSGLIMGTRSGDLDPTIIFYLLSKSYSPEYLSYILNKKSGMLALSGNSDMRDISQAYKKEDPKAKLASEMYAYRIKKYIGSYIATVNVIEAIIFTVGVGENEAFVRSLICDEMDFLGLILDEKKNTIKASGIIEIQSNKSRGKILIIPPEEEIEIAIEVFSSL